MSRIELFRSFTNVYLKTNRCLLKLTEINDVNRVPNRKQCIAAEPPQPNPTSKLPKIVQPNLKTTPEKTSDKAIKINKAMKAYLERSKAHDEFLLHEKEQFEIGRRHLANIMGKDADNFQQEDINEAINYLLPSGLYSKNARPVMLPPEVIFPKKKDAEFDVSGRPFHTLFFTAKPNFFQLLHTANDKLLKLNDYEDKMVAKGQLQSPESEKLIIEGSQWIQTKELEKKVVESLKDYHYQDFLNCFNNLVNHPYSYLEKDFIFNHRIKLADNLMLTKFPEPIMQEDGRMYVEAQGRRRLSRAEVKITDKGTGILNINGKGIIYFDRLYDREQVMFPLQFAGLLHQVDIEAEVVLGEQPSQAGALRHAISVGLAGFVSSEERERMRIAGLLGYDVRRRERKKVGQKGPRARYTWLKR